MRRHQRWKSAVVWPIVLGKRFLNYLFTLQWRLFHEMIAVDCYCCGVWPSFLRLNVWGWALRELCSLHCTAAHITTWTGSSSALSSASSRPPLKYPRQQSHCGVEYEGVCPQPWMDITITMMLKLFFFFLFLIISETQRMTRRWGLPHREGGIP